MTTAHVIGLSGYKRSGKDTAALFLAESAIKQGLTVETYAFADIVKITAAQCLGFDPSDWDRIKVSSDVNLDGKTKPARDVVRDIGMALIGVDEGYLVNKTAERIQASTADLIVLTDCRFDRELNLVRSLNGNLIKIKRLGIKSDGHITERKLDDSKFDIIIKNDSDLDSFKSKIFNINIKDLQWR